VLGLVSQSMGEPIRKGPHSAIPVHLALMSSEVAGAASVASRMLIFDHHPVIYLESWRNIDLNPAPSPGLKTGFHFFSS
ncbi:uncharacterized protein METZ01_LOCUS484143, partial [marine metagenome]